jgi:DNA-binding protein HU-beta
MTKAELIAAVDNEAKRVFGSGATRTMIENILDCLGRVAAAELAAGHEVPLPGIGKLAVKDHAAREGRNPSTGDVVQIPAKRAVVLKVGKTLKETLS